MHYNDSDEEESDPDEEDMEFFIDDEQDDVTNTDHSTIVGDHITLIETELETM
jgi:hypothetical protein